MLQDRKSTQTGHTSTYTSQVGTFIDLLELCSLAIMIYTFMITTCIGSCVTLLSLHMYTQITIVMCCKEY